MRIARVLLAGAAVAVAISARGLAVAPPAQEPAQKPAEEESARTEGLVLPTAETITFDTDEVTWPSLDISPDGTTIVFDLLGDLYTMPIEGGTATRIVGGLSFESQPVYSPDGKSIAFLSDRSGVENLWIANADGSNPRQVSRDGRTNDRPQIMVSPTWTPDGEYLIVSKSRPPDPGTFWLFMYHRDGGTGIRIGAPPPPQPNPDAPPAPQPPPPNRMGAVVSPDGRFIYYAQRNGTFTYNAQFPLWQIYRHDRETGEASQVTNARGSAMRPQISPDGKWLVYGTRHKTQTGLRVRNLESGAERWLIYPVTRDDQESRASRDTLPRYDFTPDGTSLIVPIGGKFHRVDFATGESRVLPFTAKVQAEIAPRVYTPVRVEDSDRVRARLVRWPSLSPDGRRLVFSALNRLYVMDWPNGTPRLLTSGTAPADAPPGAAEGEFMPSWSPDGQYIVYVTWTTSGGHVKRVRASGGQPETLTSTRLTARASCSSPAPLRTSCTRTCSTRRHQMNLVNHPRSPA
jgi:Tol biopolymer transport system component